MIFNILTIIVGIIATLIGLVATIIAFGCIDPIAHIWSVPMMLVGIFMIYTAGNNIIETRVDERLQQCQTENIVIEDIVEEV